MWVLLLIVVLLPWALLPIMDVMGLSVISRGLAVLFVYNFVPAAMSIYAIRMWLGDRRIECGSTVLRCAKYLLTLLFVVTFLWSAVLTILDVCYILRDGLLEIESRVEYTGISASTRIFGAQVINFNRIDGAFNIYYESKSLLIGEVYRVKYLPYTRIIIDYEKLSNTIADY